MNGVLNIIKTSQPVLTQDLGRWGYQHFGVSSAGAADKYAHRCANYLLGNQRNDTSLEIAFGNCEFEFQHETRAALCGADCNAKLNDQTLTPWTSFKVNAGDKLILSTPKLGIYAYLAVLSGFCVEKKLGSRSMNSREEIGPKEAKGFKSGDMIAYHIHTHANPRFRARKPNEIRSLQSLHWSLQPSYRVTSELRLIPSQLAISNNINWTFIHQQDFKIAADSNKMGVRLQGGAISFPRAKTYSEGVVEGCVQIPPNEQAIILMSEHQTIGGYPILGCIYAVDLPSLAQRRPGQVVKLRLGNLEDAQRAQKKLENFFANSL